VEEIDEGVEEDDVNRRTKTILTWMNDTGPEVEE